MTVHLVTVPYDSGHVRERMGAGPERLLEAGLPGVLVEAGREVTVEHIMAPDGFATEIGTSFELYRLLARRVRTITQAGGFPLTLAGNCGSALGTVSGTRGEDIGVLWFDAHGDFNTPDTTTSGFLDGMALALLTGACWPRLAAGVDGFEPLPGSRIIHVGARALDGEEGERMCAAGIGLVEAEELARAGVRAALAPLLEQLGRQVRAVYLHIDLDVLDPREVPANEYAPPGGMSVREMVEAVELVRAAFAVRAAAITAYDPACDPANRALGAVSAIARAAVPPADTGC